MNSSAARESSAERLTSRTVASVRAASTRALSSMNFVYQQREPSLVEYITKKKQEDNKWSVLRRKLDDVLQTKIFNWCLGALIVFNIFLIVLETDLNVRGDVAASWISISDIMISTIYFLEVCVRIYTYRLEFFGSLRDFLDVFIVVNDIALLIVNSAADNEDVPSFGFLKMFRMIRLVRVVKLLTMVPELQLMIKGFAFAMKPIGWGMVLIFVCLLMWSILGVQFIHPLVLEVAETGAYDGVKCGRCERAFSSVAQTMLTLTQTLVAGDDWGLVTIPVMEAHPEAFLFFLLALMTTSIGVLNLILAVVVDSAMQARQTTDHEMALEKKYQKEQAKQKLLGLCELLDKDGTGDLTLDELTEGMQDNQDFAEAMLSMDICEDDMSAVFHILDADRSGTVHYEEFVNQMHSLKTNDSHTMLVFIKYYTKTIHDSLIDQLHAVNENVESANDALLEALQVPFDKRMSIRAGRMSVRSCTSEKNAGRMSVRSVRSDRAGRMSVRSDRAGRMSVRGDRAGRSSVRSCASDTSAARHVVENAASEQSDGTQSLQQEIVSFRAGRSSLRSVEDAASEQSLGTRSLQLEKVAEPEQGIALDRTTDAGINNHGVESTGLERIEADLSQLKARLDASIRAARDDLLRMFDADELRRCLLTLPSSKGMPLLGLATSGSVPPVSPASSANGPLLTQRSTWSQRPVPPLPQGGLGPLSCEGVDANLAGGPAHDK